jgi:dihydroflavonol-4-reductase
VPESVSYVVGLGSELAARMRGTIPILNRDKVREMSYPAWTCSTERATKELGFTAAISLAQGLVSALGLDTAAAGR